MITLDSSMPIRFATDFAATTFSPEVIIKLPPSGIAGEKPRLWRRVSGSGQ